MRFSPLSLKVITLSTHLQHFIQTIFASLYGENQPPPLQRTRIMRLRTRAHIHTRDHARARTRCAGPRTRAHAHAGSVPGSKRPPARRAFALFIFHATPSFPLHLTWLYHRHINTFSCYTHYIQQKEVSILCQHLTNSLKLN